MRTRLSLVLLVSVLIMRSLALIPEQKGVLLISDATLSTAVQLYQPLFVLFDSPVSTVHDEALSSCRLVT